MDPLPTAPPATPPSPAAPVVTTPPHAPPSASQVAFDKGDFGSWRAAEHAPAPPAPAAVPAVVETPAPVPPPAPKKITLTQDELNTRTRRAVEEALQSDRQVRAAAPPPAPATPPAAPPVEKFPSIEQWSQANPTGTLNDYLDARDTFRDDQRTTAARRDAEQTGRLTELKTRAEGFREKVQAAITADPDFANQIPAEVFAAKPLSGFSREDLQAGKATFANVAAEAAFRSTDPATFLRHLRAHPDETTRIANLTPADWLVELLALDRSLRTAPPLPATSTSPAAPVAAAPFSPDDSITTAPPPAPTLKRSPAVIDPKADALARSDFGAYHRIEQAERLAQVR